MNPYRQAREVENDALARMTSPSPREEGWDEGFAAGRAAATPDSPGADEFTEAAWGLIANAYGGNWGDAPDDWHGAAARWRDEYIAGATARPPAASPDERLREAEQRVEAARIVAEHWATWAMSEGDTQYPCRMTAHPLGCVLAALDGEITPDQLGVSADSKAGAALHSLAAADREKPDKPHTQDCQDAMFMHHAATGGDMECTCRPPVSDDPTGITRPTPEPDRRARFGRIAPHVSDDPVNDPETNT